MANSPTRDEITGTPATRRDLPRRPNEPDLDAIQADSEKQALPDQEKFFRIAPRVRSKLNNLPDAAKPPLGFVPGRGFDVVFPFIKLPHLAPNLNGDWVQFGSPDLEPNRLYYGDNLQVLRTLPSNSIDLIYIDPPFFSGADYNVIWGDTNEVRTFSDIWEGGLDTYLIWLNARLWEMKRVLKASGSMFVHCDWHASHYIKAEMDKIFGYVQFGNEIFWRRDVAGKGAKRVSRQWPRNVDTILAYTKGEEWHFEQAFDELSEKQAKNYRYAEPDGRRFKAVQLGDYSEASIRRMEAEGLIYVSSTGKKYKKYYLDEAKATVDTIWTDIAGFGTRTASSERIGYPTQKPELLLERIISASSRPGDVVADFFVGGGTTASVAQRLGRRWIACDSSRVAVSVTLNRLVQLGEEQSGVMSNYGKAGAVQTRLDMPEVKAAVADIRVYYVGVYPMDRFEQVEQSKFEDFILQCLAALADTSDLPISGWRSAREPLRVGPADPRVAPSADEVKDFFEAVLKRLQPNVRFVARYVCWRISPELTAYRRRLSDYIRKNIHPRGADLDFEFLLIDSEEFRERIRQKYPDADDNEFLLRFTKEPVIGEIAATRLGQRRYTFEARDADSTNAGGYLVNCQWDFDFQRGHFAADSKYVLSRTELKGKDAKLAGRKFEAVLTAEHTFDATGLRTVACRVQDNLGAEAIQTLTLEVS